MLKRFIGDRAFYRRVLGVAVPIIIQNSITNFVSMLDNIMVGQVGTVPMSGVSIVNGLMFVFNLCIFGASSGAGIFTAQFHGSQDNEGVRYTFRYKFITLSLLSLLGIGVFLVSGKTLINLYLTGEGDAATAAGALSYGLEYLAIMVWGLLPFALSNTYSSTLRETGETVVPMVGGICAVFVNLVLNYVLIFGHFGAPQMGVRGAALATVISRYVELAIIAGWTHCNAAKKPFIAGVYRSLYIPKALTKSITLKGMPLLVNEFLWASGVAILNQCYSTCGLDVVPALSISTTIYNLTAVIFRSLGITVGIITGQMLGAGCSESEVRDSNRKQIALCVCSGVVFGVVTAALSKGFPLIFNTTDPVRQLAGQLILISAFCMPLHAYIMPVYFTLRSGGKTWITFAFDCGAIWALMLPLAFCLTRFTGLPIIPVYILCNAVDILKCGVGVVMIRKGNWVQNLAIR